MSEHRPSTQDVLLAVGNPSLSSPVCDPAVIDLAAKRNVATLIQLYDEAVVLAAQPQALSSTALQQGQEIQRGYAAAIRLASKHLQAPEGHPFSKAHTNLTPLEEQQHQVWSDFSKIAKGASKEAKDKLQAEWT